MEQKLRLVNPDDSTTTLRKIAGEHDDVNTVDYFLQQKMGKRAYFISASELYAVNQLTPAEHLQQISGGFAAYFQDIQQQTVIHRGRAHNHLTSVQAEELTLACFEPIDLDTEQMHRLRHRGISIAANLAIVGLELDQPIAINAFRDVLRQEPVDESTSPRLRLVE